MKHDEVDTDTTRAGAICALLHRAYRDLRFYPEGHPLPEEAIQALSSALTSFLADRGSLTLQVEEARLVFDDEAIYSHNETRDNVAFIMFRDGLRTVSFYSGLGKDEVQAFADCLAHADDLQSREQDLLTAFWEQDFAHLDYIAADPFQEGGVLREETIDALRETVLRRLNETDKLLADQGTREARDLSIVPNLGTTLRDLALTSQELQQSEQRVKGMAAARDDFAVILLELLANRDDDREFDGVFTEAMASVVSSYLDAADLDGLCVFLDRVQSVESRRECAAGTAGHLLTDAVSTGRLADLIRAGNRGSSDQTALQKLVDLVSSCDCSLLLTLLAESEERSVRKSLLTVLSGGDGVPARALLPLLGDPRWFVVRNALQLARASHDPLLISSTEHLTRHEDPRVRREAVRTLDALAGVAALPALARALEDSDSPVRTAAARSSLRRGGAAEEAAIRRQIGSRDFAHRPSDEMEAMLVALVSLAGERAVPAIAKLSRRRFLSSKPLAVRLAAIGALAALPSASARKLLEDASRSGEESVRLAAKRALLRQTS